MKSFSIRKKTYNLIVFFVWFAPILATNSYSRFYNYGLDINIIKVFIVVSIMIGVLLIFTRQIIEFNSNILSAILIIYILALASDPSKYVMVMFLILYALLIHLLSVNSYQIILKQYIWTCKLIILISFVDLVGFYILGSHLIAWRDPVISAIGIPRLQTIFDEPSHQVFYLLPAVIYQTKLFIHNRIRLRILLAYFFPIVATVTATAVIALTSIAIFFIIKTKKQWLNKVAIALVVLIFSFFFFETYFHKIYNIYYPELLTVDGGASSSSAMYSMLIDLIVVGNTPNLIDYIFGFGFFNAEMELLKYLDDRSLMDYYDTTGYLDQGINTIGFKGNGVVRLLFGYGVFILSIISFLIYRSRKYFLNIGVSSYIGYSLFFMWLKLPQTIELPIAIFFLFGLYEVKRNMNIKLNMGSSL